MFGEGLNFSEHPDRSLEIYFLISPASRPIPPATGGEYAQFTTEKKTKEPGSRERNRASPSSLLSLSNLGKDRLGPDSSLRAERKLTIPGRFVRLQEPRSKRRSWRRCRIAPSSK